MHGGAGAGPHRFRITFAGLGDDLSDELGSDDFIL